MKKLLLSAFVVALGLAGTAKAQSIPIAFSLDAPVDPDGNPAYLYIKAWMIGSSTEKDIWPLVQVTMLSKGLMIWSDSAFIGQWPSPAPTWFQFTPYNCTMQLYKYAPIPLGPDQFGNPTSSTGWWIYPLTITQQTINSGCGDRTFNCITLGTPTTWWENEHNNTPPPVIAASRIVAGSPPPAPVTKRADDTPQPLPPPPPGLPPFDLPPIPIGPGVPG